jgi:molybdopterin converting factor small subunit
MNVTVKFSAYKALAGTSESVLALPAGATVAELEALLAERFPRLFPRAAQAIYLVNQRIGSRDTPLSDGDQVLMLQVLAGG